MEGYKSQSPQPFFPSKHHPRSNDHDPYALPPFTPGRGRTPPRATNKSFFYLLAFFVLLCIGLLVFSLVVLHPKGPNLRIENLTAKRLAYDASSWDWPFLNATLLAGMTIRNRNFGRFEFEGNESIVGFAYEGIVLGEKEIGRGSVAARETRKMRMEMVMGYPGKWAGTGPAAGNLSRGINEKVLKLRSYGRIVGKIHLLKYLKRSLSSEMNCTMTLNLDTRNFQDLICE